MKGFKVVTKLLTKNSANIRKDISKTFKEQSAENSRRVRRLLELRNMTIKVGVVGERANEKHDGDDSLTMSQLASIHEYGLGNLPARPFLKIPITSNKQKYAEKIKAAFLATKSGKKNKLPDLSAFKKHLSKVGAEAVSDVRQFVRRVGVPPALSQDWLEYKKSKRKSTKPLIFTGQLLRAISYLVLRRDKLNK